MKTRYVIINIYAFQFCMLALPVATGRERKIVEIILNKEYRKTSCVSVQQKWRQPIPPKHWYLSRILKAVTFQKAIIMFESYENLMFHVLIYQGRLRSLSLLKEN